MSAILKSCNEQIEDLECKFISRTQKVSYYPLAVKEGMGAIIRDYDGKEYIDFLSSASSANIGHGNKEIAEVVKMQMEKIAQYTLAYFCCNEPIQLAKKLTEITPGDFDKKVLFTNSGSASNDGAIKLSRSFTGRSKIISFIEGYYGSTYGALSLSAISLNMRKKIGGLLPDIFHFNYPICLRCKYGKTEQNCSLECLKEIEYAFDHYLPAEEVAAIFFEPIAGDAGLIVPPIKYVQALYKLCQKYDILFVVDEIQQGLGRAGKWFAIEHFGVVPDMITMGKSLGAGLPMGAIIGRSEIMDSLDTPAHIFTMAGNATICKAALKMIEIMERDKLVEKSTEMGKYIMDKLNEIKEKYDIIGQVRGLGLSMAIDLVKDIKTMEKNYEAAVKICHRCFEKGLLLIFVGRSSLRIQPPLVITKEQADKALEIIEDSIKDYISGKIDDSVYKVVKGW